MTTKTTHIFAIDIGNTRIKWALFKAADEAFFNALLAKNLTVFDRHIQLQSMMMSHGHCLHDEVLAQNLPKEALAETTQVVISNVASEAVLNAVIAKLKPQNNLHEFASTAFSCGIQNHYDNPQQLGSDRWAALIAAKHLQLYDCVVVNVGTAVTIDVLQTEISKTAAEKLESTPPINKKLNDFSHTNEKLNRFNHTNEKLNSFSQTHTKINAHFLGGLILPGLRLMQTSLHQNTATLFTKSSESASAQANDFIEKNTHNAITQGAITAVTSSILYIAEQVKLQTKNAPVVILSGGNALNIAQNLTKMLEGEQHNKRFTMQSTSNAPVMIEHLVLYGLFIEMHEVSN